MSLYCWVLDNVYESPHNDRGTICVALVFKPLVWICTSSFSLKYVHIKFTVNIYLNSRSVSPLKITLDFIEFVEKPGERRAKAFPFITV